MENVMYLVAIILHQVEHLNDILSSLVELGVEDAVTIDAEPMKKSLAYKVPIFAGLKFDLKEEPFSKIILAVTENEGAGQQLVSFLKGIGIDISQPGVARIFTMKLESLFGEPEELGEI
jgi:nitrogen regulatory protein P-II 1